MKKHTMIENILIFATVAFAAVTVGYFLGRNSSRTVITTAENATVTVERLEQAEAALNVQTAESTEEVSVQEETAKTASQAESGLININTATQEELETLPGIGEELASRIIEQRRLIGGFHEKSDICNVMGIGEKKYEAIESLITVG